MKIRTGFVSNSSSSSFTIVMTEKQEKEWLDNLNVYEKQLIDESYLGCEYQTLDDQKVAVYGGSTGNYSFYEEFTPDNIEEDEELDDEEIADKYGFDEFSAWAIWESAEGKLPKNIVCSNVDM
jgi:hypothetical protein